LFYFRGCSGVQWRTIDVIHIIPVTAVRIPVEVFSCNTKWGSDNHMCCSGTFVSLGKVEVHKLKVIKLYLCSHWTVCMKWNVNLQLLEAYSLSLVDRSVVVPIPVLWTLKHEPSHGWS
jgi:hypothetical protein